MQQSGINCSIPLRNANFYFLVHWRPVAYTLDLSCTHRKKAGAFKTGKRAGQGISPNR